MDLIQAENDIPAFSAASLNCFFSSGVTLIGGRVEEALVSRTGLPRFRILFFTSVIIVYTIIISKNYKPDSQN